MKMSFFVAGLLAVAITGFASAGEHPEHPKKAVEARLALAGVSPVSLVDNGQKTEGKKEFASVHGGFEYHFASEDEKKAFDANPAKYALQHGGNCPVSKVDTKKTVKGNPAMYAVHAGKIYALADEEAKKKFEANPKQYAGEAATSKKSEHPEHPKKAEHPEHPKKSEHPEHPRK